MDIVRQKFYFGHLREGKGYDPQKASHSKKLMIKLNCEVQKQFFTSR